MKFCILFIFLSTLWRNLTWTCFVRFISLSLSLSAIIIAKGVKDAHGGKINPLVFDMTSYLRKMNMWTSPTLPYWLRPLHHTVPLHLSGFHSKSQKNRSKISQTCTSKHHHHLSFNIPGVWDLGFSSSSLQSGSGTQTLVYIKVIYWFYHELIDWFYGTIVFRCFGRAERQVIWLYDCMCEILLNKSQSPDC